MKIDYREYHFTKREWGLYIIQGILLCVIVNYLFYQNAVLYVFMIPIPMLWLKWKKKMRLEQRKKELNYQFRDALNSLSVSLRAGYSIENSLIEAEKDMRKLNGKSAEIVRELSYINGQIKVNIPVEELLTDFGERSDLEDIKNFASVFMIARKTGGNMAVIVSEAASDINEKVEVERTIETAVAAKKFEQTIMSAMPACIIVYMQMASPGFLDGLYGNLFGILFMTVCLCMYGMSWWAGRKIVEIEV